MTNYIRIFAAFVCLFLLTSTIKSQTGQWSPQLIPVPHPMLYDIDMHPSGFGLAVGKSDISATTNAFFSGVLMTADFGVHWAAVENLIHRFDPELPDYTVWRSVFILNERVAVVVGDSGMAYRTKDGGFSWTPDSLVINPDFAARPTLRDVFLISEREGIIVGGDVLTVAPLLAEVHPMQVFKTFDGKIWTDRSPSLSQTQNLTAALNTCTYSNGTLFVAGELGLLLIDNGTGYQKYNILNVPAVYRHIYTDLDAVSANEIFIVGYDDVSKTPLAYKSIRDLSRFSSILPGNMVHGVNQIGAVDFLHPFYGWLGAAQFYTGRTTDACATWTTFAVTGTSTTITSPMTGIDFIDELNGWACGGDEATNEGWLIRFSGSPPRANISVSDTQIDFGVLECERTVEADVYFRNTGTGDLFLPMNSIFFTDPGLTLVSPFAFPIIIKPGKQKAVRVRWTLGRNVFGDASATMTIYHNDPDHNPWTVNLKVKRNYGALDFIAEQHLSYGTCLKDTVYFPTVVPAVGNRPPTFISWKFSSGHNDFAILTPAPGTLVTNSVAVNFRFSPSDTGMRRGVYSVIHGNPACPDTSLIVLTGFGQRTRLRASVDSVYFGEVCAGGQKDTSIILTSIGNTFVSGGVMEHVSGDPMFGSPDWGVFLKQDSSKAFRLYFTPFRAGNFSARYRILSGPCSDTLYLRFGGRGIETKLEILPKGPIQLGPVFVNRVATRDVTITNVGTTNARITSIRLLTTDPMLQIVNPPAMPRALLPTQTLGLTLRFSPNKLGEIRTRLLVQWDSRCADTVDVEVNAICVPNPEIEAPSSADLGIQTCPTAHRDTVWIKNKGNGPLVFYSVSVSGLDRMHFSIIQPKINDTAKANSNYPIVVEFNRPVPGRSNAILRFTHNDIEAGRTDIDVTAERTVAEFVVEGDSATAFFTRLFVDQSRTFSIHNNSLQPMTVTDITVVEEAAVFSTDLKRALPVVLNPGDTMTFAVIFSPDARGPFHGIIRIAGTPCEYSIALGVHGSGDTDGLSTDRGSLTFTLDPCIYESRCQDIILKNQSPESVLVSGLNILQSGTVFSISPAVSTPFNIGPNGERTIRICAAPDVIGSRTGTLQIHSNDPAYPLLNVALASSRDSSAIIVSESAIDFGRSTVCQTVAPRRVTITNTGTLPETVTPALLNGGTAFSTSMTGPETIQPGKTYTFDVVFLRPSYGVFTDIIELTTTRCSSVFRIPLNGEYVEQSYFAAPNPAVFPTVNVGGVATRQVTLQNTGGFDAVIGSISITPAGPFSVQGAAPIGITAGGTANVPLRFNPTAEGPVSATLCVIFTSPCPDTICMTLQGEAVKGTLELYPALLAFKTLVQCENQILEDTLRNSGSGPITIVSASLSGPGLAAFTNLTPVPGIGEVIPPAGMRIFRIQYTAANAPADGPVNAALQIRTDDVVLPQFDIPLEAARVTQTVDAGGSVNFGVVEVGQPEQRTVTLRNNGSVRFCYESLSLPPQVTMTPALPICIDPGRTVDVTLTYTASAAGSFTGALALRVASPCTDSSIFQLTGSSQEGTLTQTDTVRLAPSPWCEAGSFSFTASSTYLETITLNGMRLEGADAAFFTILTPVASTLPRSIVSGGTENFVVRLSPDQRNKVFTVTFISDYTAFGQPVERRTVLIAEAVVPSFSIESATFPSTVVGQSGGTQSLRVRNTSSLPLNVSQLLVANPAFVVRSQTPTPPATLQPGAEMTVTIEFLPQVSGQLLDSLVARSLLPCPFTANGLLTGEGIPQPIVDATLTLGIVTGEVDQVIDIPLSVDKSLGGADVPGWSASVSFNRSMLYPMGVILEGTPSAGLTPNIVWETAPGTVTFGATGGMLANGTGPIGWLRCRVLVGDALTTTLTLTDFRFTGGYARVLGKVDGSFELVNYCLPGDRLLNDKPGFVVSQSIPNPVSQTRQGQASVTFVLPTEERVSLQIFDPIGRVIHEHHFGSLPAGRHSTFLPVSGLQPGVYHYVLRTAHYTAARVMVVIE